MGWFSFSFFLRYSSFDVNSETIIFGAVLLARVNPHAQALVKNVITVKMITSTVFELFELEKGASQGVVRSEKFRKILKEGQLTVLRGSTGSGKTTLLRRLAVDCASSNLECGYVENNCAVPFTSAADLEEFCNEHPKVINQLHLRNIAGADPEVLSNGERQRLIIALLIAKDIKVLLWDEGVSALDVPMRKIVFNVLFNHDVTIVAVGHGVDFVEAASDFTIHEQLVRQTSSVSS